MLYCVTVNETSLLSSDFSVVQKEFEEKNGFDKTWKQNTIFDCSLSVDDSNKEVYDQYYNTASNIKLTSLLANRYDRRFNYSSTNVFLLHGTKCLP